MKKVDYSKESFDRWGHNMRTLPTSYLGENESGWTVTGNIREDYYEWVADFQAVHPEHGSIEGNFEGIVCAQTAAGLKHFLKNHPYEEWDSQDI